MPSTKLQHIKQHVVNDTIVAKKTPCPYNLPFIGNFVCLRFAIYWEPGLLPVAPLADADMSFPSSNHIQEKHAR